MDESKIEVYENKKNRFSSIRLLCLFPILLLTILVFEAPLSKYIGCMSYADEISTIILFVSGVYKWCLKKNKIDKFYLPFILGILVYGIFGWLSTMLYQLQNASTSIFSSFLSQKFFLTVIGCSLIERYDRNDSFLNAMKIIARPIFIIVIIARLLNYIHPYEFGYDLLSYCGLLIFLLSVIIADYKSKDVLLIFIGGGMLFITGAAKAIGGMIILVAIYCWIIKLHKKIKLYDIIVLGILIIILAWQSIYVYYIYGATVDYPRAMTMLGGIKVANTAFPLGSGWGTFASYYVSVFYSPVYVKLGWENHYMLGKGIGEHFLTDNYWPSIFAETGWIGFAGFFISLLALIIELSKLYYFDKKLYASSMLIIGFMFVTTFESSSFANPAYYILSIPIGIYLGRYFKEKDDKRRFS